MSQVLKDQLAATQEWFKTIAIVKQPEQLVQGSAAWLAARSGRVTASRVADVMNVLKSGKPSASRENYLIELVAERLTGFSHPHYVTDAMQHGIDTEPLARAAYEFANDVEVDPIGMAVHPKIPLFSASPDGLVGEDGLVEFKCPSITTHIRYLRAGVIPSEYEQQCLAQMSCMPERKWLDFMSFCPSLPERLQRFTKRMYRDEEKIVALELVVSLFLKEVQEALDGLLADADLAINMQTAVINGETVNYTPGATMGFEVL